MYHENDDLQTLILSIYIYIYRLVDIIGLPKFRTWLFLLVWLIVETEKVKLSRHSYLLTLPPTRKLKLSTIFFFGRRVHLDLIVRFVAIIVAVVVETCSNTTILQIRPIAGLRFNTRDWLSPDWTWADLPSLPETLLSSTPSLLRRVRELSPPAYFKYDL